MNKLEKFTKAKNIFFFWDAPLHKTKINIIIPDFSLNKYSVWGD